jgi:hypothetical protein
MAKMGIPDLADDNTGGQELKSQCNLAGVFLAI